MTVMRALLLVGLSAAALVAQCHGNGGQARLDQSIPAIASPLSVGVSGTPGETYSVWISGDIVGTPVPGLGTICLDLGSPILGELFAGSLSASGSLNIALNIPNNSAWLGYLWFMQGIVTDPTQPGGLALSNTLRFEYENPDSVESFPTWEPRAGATTTLLPERGWVLVAGGATAGTPTGINPGADAEVFFPLLDVFAPVGSMSTARYGHTSSLLPDGRVLVVGGVDSEGAPALSSCEIFDPATLTFTPAAPLGTPRVEHTATVLNSGQVFVAGGSTVGPQPGNTGFLAGILNTGEIYDPVLNAWSPAANTMQLGRASAAALRRQDGTVLLAGGQISGSQTQLTATCESFDPITNLFSAAPSFAGAGLPRSEAKATLLPNGDVFLAGGRAQQPLGAILPLSVETLLLTPMGWQAGPPAPRPLYRHGQVLLGNGDVYIAGGDSDASGAAPETCWLYRPSTMSFHPAAPLSTDRDDCSALRLNDGRVLVVGGRVFVPFTNLILATASLYTPTP